MRRVQRRGSRRPPRLARVGTGRAVELASEQRVPKVRPPPTTASGRRPAMAPVKRDRGRRPNSPAERCRRRFIHAASRARPSHRACPHGIATPPAPRASGRAGGQYAGGRGPPRHPPERERCERRPRSAHKQRPRGQGAVGGQQLQRLAPGVTGVSSWPRTLLAGRVAARPGDRPGAGRSLATWCRSVTAVSRRASWCSSPAGNWSRARATSGFGDTAKQEPDQVG